MNRTNRKPYGRKDKVDSQNNTNKNYRHKTTTDNSESSYSSNKSFTRNDGNERPKRRFEKNSDRPSRRFEKDGERLYKKEFDTKDENYVENLQLEGRNAVLEGLNHNKSIDKIFIKSGEIEGSLKVIIAKAREKGIAISEVSKFKLDEMSHGNNHQGVIALCPSKEYVEVIDIINIAKAKNEEPFIIILDGITDPHNLGAIIRSADCCGAHGVVIPKRRSASVTGIVSKTSAGAIEHVPVARVTNISAVIDELKKQNIWVACGDIHGKPYFKENLKGAIALVIGSEGEGVSKLINKKCDYIVKIPMYGNIDSLNASVAAGLLMYEVVRQREFI